jgi:hypothetical protein
MKNKAASQLGRMAKGIPKTLSQQERERRRQSLAKARKKRWNQPSASVESAGKVSGFHHQERGKLSLAQGSAAIKTLSETA